MLPKPNKFINYLGIPVRRGDVWLEEGAQEHCCTECCFLKIGIPQISHPKNLSPGVNFGENLFEFFSKHLF